MTPKQQRFVAEYLKDLNATQAAIRAGYSPKTAESQGSRLLSKAKVASAVAAGSERRFKKLEFDAEAVLRELLLIARVDLAQAYDPDGRLKPIHKIPEDVRRAIAGVKVFEEFDGSGADRVKVGEVRELKFWDKPRALELLGKHLVLFTEKHEHAGAGGAPLAITFRQAATR